MLQNSLLNGTTSHLAEEQLRHQLKAGMDEKISKKATAEKVNQEKDFKKWLASVKCVDDGVRTNHKEFECIVKSACNQDCCSNNMLAEPSCHANTTALTAIPNSMSNFQPCTPKLIEIENQLIFDNDGCLKCHQFFVPHKSAPPNSFPNAALYQPLTQADVERAKRSQNTKSVASVTPATVIATPSVLHG